MVTLTSGQTEHNRLPLVYRSATSPSPIIAGGTASSDIGSYDYGAFYTTDAPFIFIEPGVRDPAVLPPNHPAWLALEQLLDSIEPDEFDFMDDEWLDDLRAGWGKRLEDIYGPEDWD